MFRVPPGNRWRTLGYLYVAKARIFTQRYKSAIIERKKITPHHIYIAIDSFWIYPQFW